MSRNEGACKSNQKLLLTTNLSKKNSLNPCLFLKYFFHYLDVVTQFQAHYE
jgi:hypothetical protein